MRQDRRRYQHRRLYGIELKDRARMWAAQHGLCGVCGKPLRALFDCHLDHNHETGKLRALVHPRCNVLVSFMEKDAELTKMALAYIESDGPNGVPIVEGTIHEIATRFRISYRQARKVKNAPILADTYADNGRKSKYQVVENTGT